MENGVAVGDSNTLKMGATSNPNAARLAALQERKKAIEESLAERNKELRQLCIQEAELTGIMPLEIPLEPGESPPSFRRRVGTAYQLSQNLINSLNNKDESIPTMELEKQIQANMAEAALGLANEPNISKTIRRQHRVQYQYHKQQYNLLEEKLAFLKSHTQATQQQSLQQQQQSQPKQKKKPRPPEQDDSISVTTNDTFGKSALRHSMRSLQHPPTSEADDRYSLGHQRLGYRGSDNSLAESSPTFLRSEDLLANGLYRLSISGYKNYMERREGNVHTSQPYIHTQSNSYQPHLMQATSLTLPHVSRRSPQQSLYNYNYNHHSLPEYKYNTNLRQHSSPNAGNNHNHLHSKVQYYPSYTQPNYRPYSNIEPSYRVNSHQIQPHQQYEHDMGNTGLGGYWKQTETGETVWCSSYEDNWQRDKRFGSLDRRKNKRLHKRTSPLVESKSNTLPAPSPTLETPSVKSSPQALNRQDSRQLIRTQSLGSVGAQTWPNEEISSCESDSQSMEVSIGGRKQKQKEWYETSLDGPTTPTLPRPQSVIPPATEEQKYPPPLPPPPKPPLEIPAESNPSPRIAETNIELLNNNIPKNCTIVQAGICKPYHEETKPFEMSDFYKYSTKFNKSPKKQMQEQDGRTTSQGEQVKKNLNENFDQDVQKTVYQPLQAMRCQEFNISNTSFGTAENSANASLDLSQLSSDVAEKFAAEMNDWYKNKEHQIETGPSPKGHSTATLV